MVSLDQCQIIGQVAPTMTLVKDSNFTLRESRLSPRGPSIPLLGFLQCETRGSPILLPIPVNLLEYKSSAQLWRFIQRLTRRHAIIQNANLQSLTCRHTFTRRTTSSGLLPSGKKKKGCFSLPSTSISLTTTLSKRKKWVRLYQVRNAMSQSPSRLFLAALLDASRSELHEVRNSYTSLFSCPKLLLLLNACSLGNPWCCWCCCCCLCCCRGDPERRGILGKVWLPPNCSDAGGSWLP